MRRAIIGISVTVMTIGIAAPSQATFPGNNGVIAYDDFRADPNQISTVEPDGSPVTQLTTGNRNSFDPAYSSDGAMIAFVRARPDFGGRYQLATMDADGSNTTVLLRGVSDNRKQISSPTWSPDGSQIAFCGQNGRNARVYVVNADGSGLANISGPGHSECNPSWSPDGSTIAFATFRNRGIALATMNADGSNRTIVVGRGVNDFPDWSPDGMQIVFCRRIGGNPFDIFTVGADGSGRTRLTDTPNRWEWTPVFSPDGTVIAFSRAQGRNVLAPGDIFTMAPDGSAVTRVTDTNQVDEFRLNWQPIP